MAKGFVVGGGGGGTSSDDLTATKNLVPSGYTYVGKDTDDDPGTGTAPIVQATTYQPKTTNQVIAAGSYLQGAQTIAATTGTAVAADVRLNKTFNSSAGIAVKGTIPDLAGSTITPKNTAQTVASANKYMTGNVVVNGDANFVAANIKKGVKIWGVTGTWEGYVPIGVLDIYNHGTLASGWSIGGAVAMADSIIVTSRDVRVNFLTAPSINLAITAAMTYLNIEFELMESVAYNYAILSLHTTSNKYLYYTAFGSTVEQESENYSYGTTVCYKKQALVVGVPTVIQIPLKYARTTLDKPYMTFAGGKNTSDYIIKVTHIWIS